MCADAGAYGFDKDHDTSVFCPSSINLYLYVQYSIYIEKLLSVQNLLKSRKVERLRIWPNKIVLSVFLYM